MSSHFHSRHLPYGATPLASIIHCFKHSFILFYVDMCRDQRTTSGAIPETQCILLGLEHTMLPGLEHTMLPGHNALCLPSA